MKNKLIIFFIFLSFSLYSANDTLRVMQYNLLNYGNYTSYCTVGNNNIEDKDENLITIIDYVRPDIFSVNEINENSYYHQHLLDAVLNINGINYYQKAQETNIAGSTIVNMLYYNSDKLGLSSQDVIETDIRDINLYRLFYKPQNAYPISDTIFLNCITAHLKSGNTSSSREQRANMTLAVMNYISDNNFDGNNIFMGDLNVYYSSEEAYQNLTENSPNEIKFYDPINAPGNWHSNSSYSFVHTQSTHLTSNGCSAGGGMDDRFDFILLSEKMINFQENIGFISGTYTSLGQDGLHFNQSINDPQNNSAPEYVIEAIYNMSDHLPVYIDLLIEPNEISPHFEFAGGNPAMPIWTIYLSEGTIDGENLQADDEIAIFDNDILVGAFILDEILSPENQWDNNLIAWSELTNGQGYSPGDSYSIKCWDASEVVEVSNFEIEFFNPYGDAYSGNVFPEGDGQYSISSLAFNSVNTQTIILNSGYQIISSNLIPPNPDLLYILENNLNSKLDFVRNSNGLMLRKIGPNWVNGIGDWITSEAYLFRMNDSDLLTIEGNNIDPQTPIQLNEGYQFVAYLPSNSMNALTAFQTILNENLKFIRNSSGNMILKIGPNWVNGIGDAKPKEGYLIRMNLDDVLVYPFNK
ncbi:MAG: hypothetical protein JEY97_03720 [Bacteroidales bacterium]|nr:hypothetical protein [Bacteroidales bacterium]